MSAGPAGLPLPQGLQALGARLAHFLWRGVDPQARKPRRERWVLVDVESSGLDVRRDALLAIAAVGLEVDWDQGHLLMNPGDSLALDLRPDEVSGKDNILLHGIGVERQRRALAPALALRTFLDWTSGAPLVAFHAAFDQALLARECRRQLGAELRQPWLDIAPLCAVSQPEVRARSLDEWLAHFAIPCAARHQATADVLAEAELLQRVWPRVAAECRNLAEVRRYAGRQAWIRAR